LSRSWDVVVAGHICLDFIPDLSQSRANSVGALLRPGQLIEVGAAVVAELDTRSSKGELLHGVTMDYVLGN